MNLPSLSDLKDYFLVGASILFFGSLLSLPFTLVISLVANDSMSLPVLLLLAVVDFAVRATAMGFIAFYAYIGDDK